MSWGGDESDIMGRGWVRKVGVPVTGVGVPVGGPNAHNDRCSAIYSDMKNGGMDTKW